MNARCGLASLLLIAARAVAQAPDPCATAPASCATLIETYATSETRVPNSVVDVVAVINVSGKDLVTVERSLAQKSGSLTSYLKGQQAQRLITARVFFSPQMKYENSGPEKVVAYNGGARLSFRASPDKLAEILAGVLTSGADNIQSTTFTPTEEEIAEAQRQLAEDATRTAVAQAESIAKAAGMHTVSVRRINVENTGAAPHSQIYTDGFLGITAERKTALPIATASGEDGISVRVDVVMAAAK